MKRIQNFWYHYKTAAIIAAVIIAAGAYLVLQQSKTEKPDYEVAVVSPDYFTEEQLSSLKDVLQSVGEDCNGDGSVAVNLRVYRIALGQDGQDSAVIGALDADLVGNVSGLFLLDDPGKFEETANGICKSSEACPIAGCEKLKGLGFDGLFLSCRTGAEKKYAAMLEALTA